MLKCIIEFRKGILFVRLKGVVNINTLNVFNEEVKEVILRAGIKYVVLNINEVYYVSKEGVSEIKKLRKMINDNNGMFFLISNEFNELKLMSNLDNELNVFKRVVI